MNANSTYCTGLQIIIITLRSNYVDVTKRTREIVLVPLVGVAAINNVNLLNTMAYRVMLL